MSNKWYYLVKGKIQGPVTENQIRELLREHELTLNDIIFREGDSKWRRINEFNDIDFAVEAAGETNLHHFVKLPKQTSEPGKWVVLLSVQTDTETKFVQKGPFSEDEVKALITKGEVSYSDHIWRAGFDKWQRIGDLDEFAFKGETQILSLSSLHNKAVEIKPAPAPVLKLNDEDIRFDQGTKTEIIGSSPREDSFDDFKTAIIPDIKKTIQQEILSEPEKIKNTSHSLKLDQSRIQELLKKTETKLEAKIDEKTLFNLDFTRSQVDRSAQPKPQPTQPQPGQTGKIPSLTPSATTSMVINRTQSRPIIKFDEVEENRKESTLSFTRTKMSRKTKKKVWNSIFKATQMILLLVVLGLGFAVYQNIEKRNRKIREKVQAIVPQETKPAHKVKAVEVKPNPAPPPVVKAAEVVAPEPPPPASVKPSPAPASVEKEVPEPKEEEEESLASKTPEPEPEPIAPRKGPAFVQIKIVSANSSTPKITLSSNANEGEKIKVVVKGVTGEILGAPSFFVEAQVKRKRRKPAEVNLANYGVRPGYYNITATLADAKVHKDKVFIGSKKAFEKGLSNYRKVVSHRQQWEKKSLLKVASQTTDLTKELFSKYSSLASLEEWRPFYQKWKSSFRDSALPELKSISARNQNDFAYPDIWFDVRSLREKLTGEAESLNNAFLASRKSASLPNNELLSEIGSLVTRVGELSGWRQKATR